MATPYSRAELVQKGFMPPKKADEKTWPLPLFCLQSDWKFLPLHIQVRFVDEMTTMLNGDKVHLKRGAQIGTFKRGA